MLPYPKCSYPQPGTGFILSPSLPIQYFAPHLIQTSVQHIGCSSQICKSILMRNSTPQHDQHIHGAPDHHVHTVQHIFGVGFCWLVVFLFVFSIACFCSRSHGQKLSSSSLSVNSLSNLITGILRGASKRHLVGFIMTLPNLLPEQEQLDNRSWFFSPSRLHTHTERATCTAWQAAKIKIKAFLL